MKVEWMPVYSWPDVVFSPFNHGIAAPAASARIQTAFPGFYSLFNHRE